MPSYIAIIDKDYAVRFPDFPGLLATAPSMAAARSQAAELLTIHLEELRADGKRLPVPSALETIMADPNNQDGVAVMVESTT
jgi:predicted RNase H-like HicB family nuclease